LVYFYFIFLILNSTGLCYILRIVGIIIGENVYIWLAKVINKITFLQGFSKYQMQDNIVKQKEYISINDHKLWLKLYIQYKQANPNFGYNSNA